MINGHKLVDGFIFYNEFDLLDLRLEELSPLVDKFVLVEANETFANRPKPFYFDENKERYSAYKDKIIHIKIGDMPHMENGNRWTQETYSFNKITDGFIGLDENDIVMISAVDEIPNIETLVKNIDMLDGGPACMIQKFFYYYLNCINITQIFHGTAVSKYKFLTTPDNFIRERPYFIPIKDGGWHFSYLGGPEAIVEKLESFSHSEYDTNYYKDKNRLVEKIKSGQDIFDRPLEYKIVPVDSSFPKTVLNNLEKYDIYISKEI